MSTIAAPPLETELVEPPLPGRRPSYKITKVWANWLRSLTDRTQTTATAVQRVALSGQHASIGLTSLVQVAAGVYRVSWRFRVTTAGSVSSSLTFTLTATDGGVTVTQASAAYAGNDVTKPQSGVFLMRCDPASPLQFSTTYASAGGTAMQYAIDITVEAI